MKKEQDLPIDFVNKCRAITAKRARTVIDHLLKYGFITSQELKDTYGYNHPPRAIRDVKENGIPMEMFRTTGTDGRSVGAYRFGDPATARVGKFSGRTILGKELRTALIKRDGAKCAIYLETFPAEQLQIDHRVPSRLAATILPRIKTPPTTCLFARLQIELKVGVVSTVRTGKL